VQVEADDPAQDLRAGDEDRCGDRRQRLGQRVVLRGRDEHRTHGPPGSEQRFYDVGRLGDEEAPFGLDAPSQVGIGQPDVIGQSGIVRVVDRDHGHSGTVQVVPRRTKKP